MTRESKNLVVGLDIGTSKIVTIVAEVLDDGRMEVIGLGQADCEGLKKGVVVNIDATVQSIQKSLEDAELMADCKIASVWTGIAGSHIRSFNSTGMVAIKDKEVSHTDVERVIETATAVSVPSDQQVLHVLPQEFMIDGQDDVREPLGMSGVRLEVRVHIVTGSVSAAQNIVKCIRRCGLEVNELILQPLASSHAVLTQDEKELGVALVDIGGGTTEVGIISLGGMVYKGSVRIGGDKFDEAIVNYIRRNYGMLIGDQTAENLKKQIGVAFPSAEFKEMDVTGRNLSQGIPQSFTVSASEILEALTDPLNGLVTAIKIALENTPPELSSDIAERGIMLTGGGALLRDLDRLIDE
jgi:cell division protein FtsA